MARVNGLSVETLVLSEVLGWGTRPDDADAGVQTKVAEIKSYADYGNVPRPRR